MSLRAARLVRPFGLFAAILLAALAGLSPSALANDTPGNNGTVKIHEGAGENDPGEVRNEPHVCTFHLHFYFADPEQSGTWQIEEWAPTGEKGTVVLSGTYDTAGDGVDRQPAEGVYTLPDGHYKLFWDGDLDTAKHDKMKVFWVDCVEATPSPSGSESPTETASETPVMTPSESASESPTESASESPTESASESASPSESASESASPSESASESASPTGSELPTETASESASPTGSELPIETSTSAPTGGVGGITATPPPTDTELATPTASTDGWRLVLLGLAAAIAAAVFLLPTRQMARVAERKRRRR